MNKHAIKIASIYTEQIASSKGIRYNFCNLTERECGENKISATDTWQGIAEEICPGVWCDRHDQLIFWWRSGLERDQRAIAKTKTWIEEHNIADVSLSDNTASMMSLMREMF